MKYFSFDHIAFIWLGGGGVGQSENFAEDAERVQKPVSGGFQGEQCHPNILQEYKAKCPTYFKEDEEKDSKKEEEEKDSEKEKDNEDKEERKVCKSWDFKEQLVFQRFDSFVERLKTIQDFCNTANQFLKLEKVLTCSNIELLFVTRWKLVASGERCSPRQFRKSMRLSGRFMQFLEIGGI